MIGHNPRLEATVEEVGRHFAASIETDDGEEIDRPVTLWLWWSIEKYVEENSEDFDDKSTGDEEAPVYVFTGDSPKPGGGTDPTADDEDHDGRILLSEVDF